MSDFLCLRDERAGRWCRWPRIAPRPPAVSERSGRRRDTGEDEVAVGAGQPGLGDLLGVVAEVDVVLVHRDVPGLLRERAVEALQRGLLVGTGGAERLAQCALDDRVVRLLRVD